MFAVEAPAKEALSLPCSDVDGVFPPCKIPKPDKKKAKSLYKQAMALEEKQKLNEALMKMRAARAISPLDAYYQNAEKAVAATLANSELRAGDQAMLRGDAKTAIESFRRALEADPSNEYAEQRLHDAMPAPEREPVATEEMGETRLEPKPGVRNFVFRGSSQLAMRSFAQLFGISVVPYQDLSPREVKVKLDNVDWETGSQILLRLSKTLMVPLTENQILLANDTEQNRRDLTRMTLRTFSVAAGSTPTQLNDLTTALRTLFELRYITPNPSEGTIVIRAPQATMDAIARFIDDMQDERPTVMLEVKVFEVSTTFTRDLGTSVPNDFTVFNVDSEIGKLVSGGEYSEIVSLLESSGESVNATTILAALLASTSSSGTSSVLAQPFATFGGGTTLTGVTVPQTTFHFSDTSSLARTIDDVLLRSVHGSAATLKIGERYPIVSSTFSASSATSSLLQAAGLSSATTATSVPTPQFQYEDIGLVLKATPQVHGKLISLDFEFMLRALGATQSNGLPLLTNREVKGTISTEDGNPVVIAGLVDNEETLAMNGIPVISSIPVLGQAMSVTTKENTHDELLIVMRPFIVMGGNPHGVYVPVPMSGPK